ncbi:MAG: ion channel [Pseudomonadota bacterium]
MIHLMRRYLLKGFINLSTHGWTIISLLLLLLYVSGYILMSLFGEAGVVQSYSWWFAVTITTVGYGDISPTTAGGQWVAIIIMILGIGSIALLIGKIAEWVIHMSEKQINGSLGLRVTGHILIMGYRGSRTKKLIAELLADMEDDTKKIVLCSSSLKQNPFDQEKVKFVKGELASDDVLKRSCCINAEKVIITGDDDDQTFFTAFAIRQINTYAHLVAFMQNEEHVNKLASLPADHPELNQTILPSAINLIVQEIQDPQSSHVLQQLMSNLHGATLYQMPIPDEIEENRVFADLFINFRQHYDATILAIKDQQVITNPPMDMQINTGMSFFYMAKKRLKTINWKKI